MARTVVGYIRQYLNNSASASPTMAQDPVTASPIATGTTVGAWQEFSANEALQFSSKQVSSVQILTAGSGQTPGTYTATASSGGAVIQYVIAAGGTMTAVPTVINGGSYSTDTAPTFTIAAGGTPATVSANLGFLYEGVYAWVQLDPAVAVGAIPVGTPLYWLAGQRTFIVTTVASGNFPDFAGFSIDPAFGALNGNGQQNQYAFIQMTGKAKALFGSAVAAFGDIVNLAGTPGATVVAVNTGNPNGAVTNLTVGYALATGTTLTPSLIRVTRAQSRV